MLKRRVVRPSDDVVIEGFPRSANSFASISFDISQPRPIRFGNHFHSPAQFLLARRYKVPAMLVVREPVAAALSFVVFQGGGMTARHALLRYVLFHRPLLGIADSYVVAPFGEVTSAFGQSIDRLNRRFGTNFNRFEHTPENVQKVFDTIDTRRSKRVAAGVITDDPLRSTRPSQEKAERRADFKAAFDDKRLNRLKSEAYAQYEALTAAVE